MSNAIVSVAMCTYNGEQYVEEQLLSIVQQTYSNLEIVVCDDGSTDRTVDIVQRIACQDARVRLIQNEQNLGFVKNFEKALALCTGEVIALADQDDVWFPEKIEQMLTELGDHALVYSNVQLMDAEGNKLDQTFPNVRRLQGRCALGLILDNCVIGHASVIRRSLLDDALPLPDGIKVHDQWLAIVAALTTGLKASDKVLSYYRKHSQNVMLNKAERSVPRYVKKRQADEKIACLAQAMLQTDLLNQQERTLLAHFLSLLMKNEHRFYNHTLAQFLQQHAEQFLPLYADKKKQTKVARKLARGKYYLKWLPFS